MKFTQVVNAAQQRLKRTSINRQVRHLASQVALHAHPDPTRQPVIFFNASTRLVGMSLNAAFSLLTSWALRLQGIPVIQFTCWAGMSHCVLGTSRENATQPPPCRACIAQSKSLYSAAQVVPFTYQPDPSLQAALAGLDLQQLQDFTCSTSTLPSSSIPLGKLALPSLRWVLRCHNLQDDQATCYLLKEYIQSAWWVAQEFSALLDRADPLAVVVFNGQFFPEATVRWICQHRHIRNITHEVGLQPFSAFFTPGEATAYPLTVPEDFELNDQQNARLDEYLEQRFQGKFSMAGIRFWPGMQGIDGPLLQRIEAFKHIVPVFTNVIFDTSQPHSNVLFEDMFAWLDLLLDQAEAHPDTLFIIRAHPDEERPGKESRQSVRQWAEQRQVSNLPNVVFIGAHHTVSSYELIQRAKFVMIYNSTIGLEASLMGAAVLCAGRARFTQLPTVFFPATIEDYRQQLDEFLSSPAISPPPEFRRNARRFLYFQLYRSSLPFADYLQEDGIWPGFVRLRPFDLSDLSPSASPAIRAILKGLLEGCDFLLQDDASPSSPSTAQNQPPA